MQDSIHIIILKIQHNMNIIMQDNTIRKMMKEQLKIIVAIIIAAVTFPIWSGILGVYYRNCFWSWRNYIGLGVAGISLIVVAISFGYGFATSVLLMGIGLILFGVAILLVIPEACFVLNFCHGYLNRLQN